MGRNNLILPLFSAVILLISGLFGQERSDFAQLDIFYHLELKLELASGNSPATIGGINHIKVKNLGNVSVNKLFIRNNSNKYFKANNEKSPRTYIGNISGTLLGEQPEWAQAVMPLELKPALLPGEETIIHIPFETYISASSGKYYPTVGSREDTTIYVLQSFYPRLEYIYADGWRENEYKLAAQEHPPAADYLVSLTTPGGFVVANSGVILSGPNDESIENSFQFAATNIRDFSMVASKYFDRETIHVPGMAVSLLMTPGKLKKFKKMKPAIQDILKLYINEYGPSNSPELTITSAYSLGTDMASKPNMFILSQDDQITKNTLAHELAHQWFGNLGAVESPDDWWLIESVAEYAADSYFRAKKAKTRRFKGKTPANYSFKDLKTNISDKKFVDWIHLAYEISGENNLPPFYEPEKKKWEQSVNRYSVYSIGNYSLQMLRESLGQEKTNRILSAFSKAETSSNISSATILEIIEKKEDEKIATQLRLALTTAAKVDIVIEDVISTQMSNSSWGNKVIFTHKGKWLFPVNMKVITISGDTLNFEALRFATRDTFRFKSKSAVKNVEIDPEKHMFDSNGYNNRWPKSFTPQPLSEIPSWKVYSVYFRPRALNGWDGGQRFGVRYSGRLGINLMPYQSALYQHAFDLDILFATSRSQKNWAWQFNYKTPVKSTDLMFWQLTAGYDYPRNIQSMSFVFYVGQPLYWAVNGKSAYKRLTTKISRMEYTESDSTSWWRNSQSWTLREQFVWFNYTGDKRHILRGSLMTGIYVYAGEKHRISKISSSFDFEKHYPFGLIFRTHIDGGLARGASRDNSFRFRIKQVAGGWKNRENYIPLFRGSTINDKDWQSSVLSSGFSLGIETKRSMWPMIYSDIVMTGDGKQHKTIKKQISNLLEADPLYVAVGIGLESQSIIEFGVYFPFWVSHPGQGEKNFNFRMRIQAGFYF